MSDQERNEERRDEAERPPPPAPQDRPNPEAENQATSAKVSQLENRISRYERGMLRWTRAVAAFTGASVLLTILYVYSFIKSERAYLIIKSDDVAFINGELSADHGGADLRFVVRNYGKHIAQISGLSIIPFIGNRRPLPDTPEYRQVYNKTTPPIPPDTDTTVIFEAKENPALGNWPELVQGISDGTIPLWIYGQVIYDTGYPSISPGELGFCFEYQAVSKRGRRKPFLTCEKPSYTYVR